MELWELREKIAGKFCKVRVRYTHGSEHITLMSETTAKCWKCDVCGYIWLKVGRRRPVQCPNRRCRTRKWNVAVKVVSEPKYLGDSAPLVTVQEMSLAEARRRWPEAEVPKMPVQPAAGPSMDVLREMAAGRIPADYREPLPMYAGPPVNGFTGNAAGVDKTPAGILSGGVGNAAAEIPTPAGKTAYPVAEGEALFFLGCQRPPIWDETNREHVYCRLPDGHKGRCQEGRRVSVDD
jgi:hypothetical protein